MNIEIGEVLLDILIVLIAAKAAAEIAERVGFPGVVAEILAGVLIGPSVLDFVVGDETLRVLGELGVILLLLQVGMEMNLRELGAVGRASLSVAVIGVVVPMLSGFGVAELLGYSDNTALFLGAALAATSVGITARVFSDLRALASVEARTVLGAAVADDVFGLVILTVVVRVVSEGSISIGSLFEIVGVAIGFLIVATAVGSKFGPPLFQHLQRYSRSAGTLVALTLAFTLAFAELADAAQLAPIVGAFVAGLALSRSTATDRIKRELAPVGHLFIPVFFLQIGIDARIDEFVNPDVLAIAGTLFVVAVLGKLVAAFGAMGSPGDKRLIGLGMLPRGEVGLIFATIGLQQGVLGRDLYAGLLLVVLATTLLAPPLLRRRLRQMRAARPLTVGEAMPEGGWLRVSDGVVDLAARPPEHLALDVGLDAALVVAGDLAPGRALLDWLATVHEQTVRWSDGATKQLFAVLRDGNPRSWRFLETTNVLELALPELEETLDRRRADPFMLDPSHVLEFSLVSSLREVPAGDPNATSAQARLEHPEWLLLTAFILDVAGEDASPVQLARRIVHRLDLGAAAEEEIALLVGDSSLLRAAAARVDGLDEDRVIQLTTHLDTAERARALYLLTLALEPLEPWVRDRLDHLLELVLVVLDRPSVTGLEARNLVERRRAEAIRLVGTDRKVLERIQHAPRAYLLAESSADIARQAALLEPLPGRRKARVAVVVIGDQEWRVEVALRDRPGLLARVSGVLADSGLDVLDAVIATWPDGGALESFRVRHDVAPVPADLEAGIVEALEQPIEAPPNPDAAITFDDDGSPWYTLCEVRSPDLRGLLHTIAVGLASAGADVHSARVGTDGGEALDRFELTDRNSRKLDTDTKDAIVRAIVEGVNRKRRSRLRSGERLRLRR